MKSNFNLHTGKEGRRDRKKAATFRTLAKMLEQGGENVWEARMKARQLVKLKPTTERGK